MHQLRCEPNRFAVALRGCRRLRKPGALRAEKLRGEASAAALDQASRALTAVTERGSHKNSVTAKLNQPDRLRQFGRLQCAFGIEEVSDDQESGLGAT